MGKRWRASDTEWRYQSSLIFHKKWLLEDFLEQTVLFFSTLSNATCSASDRMVFNGEAKSWETCPVFLPKLVDCFVFTCFHEASNGLDFWALLHGGCHSFHVFTPQKWVEDTRHLFVSLYSELIKNYEITGIGRLAKSFIVELLKIHLQGVEISLLLCLSPTIYQIWRSQS